MSKAKPKTADLITAFTNELEEKFRHLEVLERRLKETENNMFDSQEKLLRSIKEERVAIQNTEIDIDLEPANQWEKSFQTTLNQGIERLKKEFKLSSNKLSIFYKSIGIAGVVVLIFGILLYFSQARLKQARIENKQLQENTQIMKAYNSDLIEFLESKNQSQVFEKWLETKHNMESQ